MKDFLIVVLLLMVGAGWAYYHGHSHVVQLRYECGIEVPIQEAFFLNTEHCPGDTGS